MKRYLSHITHKVLASALLALFVFASMGVHARAHYCMGALQSLEVADSPTQATDDDLCERCGMDLHQQAGDNACCQITDQLIKVDTPESIGGGFVPLALWLTCEIPTLYRVDNFSSAQAFDSHFFTSYDERVPRSLSTYLRCCALLI